MKTLGQIAYDAYCDSRHWKSVRGEELPRFIDQHPDLIGAWQKAAEAVMKEVLERQGLSDRLVSEK